MSYTAPVTKRPPLGIRFDQHEQEALEAAAKADERPTSALGRKIILAWLRGNGWLPNEGPKPPSAV